AWTPARPGRGTATMTGSRTEPRSDRSPRRAPGELRRELLDSLVSVAGMVGRPVKELDGSLVGRLDDVVVPGGEEHPPVLGYIVGIAHRRVWLHAGDVAGLERGELILQRARFDLVDVVRRAGEIQLYHDVVDHQLVDLNGVRVVRASDLYLGHVAGRWELVGVDTSWRTYVRRALPGAMSWRPTPSRVLDWAGVHSLAVSEEKGVRLDRPNSQLRLLSAADVADLLADLGRTERQRLLGGLETPTAATVLKLLTDRAAASLLGDAPVERAARLVREMEPDEAVDALRRMHGDERERLLVALGPEDAADLRWLLGYEEDTAAGMMTPALVTVPASGCVGDAVAALNAARTTPARGDVVILVDADGALVDDLTAAELLGEPATRPLRELAGAPWPVTVHPGDPLHEVVRALRHTPGASVVVVDAAGVPIGRVHADDLVDALATEERRWVWHRVTGGPA
ncbi:MAG TPA: CBS domain-containing protein, partial [Propionibacteriaceae bacterium]|nr:CBS domain-containing protein [Propionibacteriaceae bacterium]